MKQSKPPTPRRATRGAPPASTPDRSRLEAARKAFDAAVVELEASRIYYTQVKRGPLSSGDPAYAAYATRAALDVAHAKRKLDAATRELDAAEGVRRPRSRRPAWMR